MMHDDVCKQLSFSKDETKLVTSCWDLSAHVWSLPGGQLLNVLKGHILYVQGAFFLGNGNKIITTSADTTLGVWDTATGLREKTMGSL